MINDISIGNVLNSIIPISRFNKGEAGKIFDEVNESGTKIVVKNNKPTCVLITPERYEEMMEIIENNYLLQVAEERMKYAKQTDFIDSNEIMKQFGIEKEELKNIEVEIE